MQSAQQNLNDFLRRIHLGSEMYYIGQLCDTWKLSTPGSGATSFHLVSHGDVWLHMDSLPQPMQLLPGDIAFFPQDAAHAICDRPYFSPEEKDSWGRQVAYNRNAPGAGLICGHLRLPAHLYRLLLASFPDFLLVRPDNTPVGQRMRDLIELMMLEAEGNELGVTAILDRLSDMLFLYIIRHTLHLNPRLSPLLIATTDEHLRLATQAFIETHAEPWTVDSLAKKACLSRTAFAERFSSLVGMPPMEFVATWRVQLASGWLADGNANMLDVALRCGYESEAAFRKAFKRITGTSPGKARKGKSSATPHA